MVKFLGSNFMIENIVVIFIVCHFVGEVDYLIKGFIEENGEIIFGDFFNFVNFSKSEFVFRFFG